MSVASEIERIQSAKVDLKTSINAKTDSSHQITDETIDEYADFVDSIQTGGGGQAYRLPDAYQEVTYIESSGTQYINTGYYATGDSKFELKVTYGTTAGVVYGSYNSQGNWTSGNGYYHNSNTSNYEFTQYLSNSMTSQPGSVNSTHTIVVNKGNVTVNGIVTNTIGSKTFTQNYPTFIFAGNNAGTIVEQPFAFKLYYFKISEGTTVLRDFIPCYRKSDNEVGLYDLINDVFYTNQGSGSFAKGNDHNEPFIKLQTKNITITTNKVTKLTADTGYVGLDEVNITTNVSGDTPVTYEYVTDGLIAWWEGEDDLDANNHWNSRVGNDYIYQYKSAVGSNTDNPFSLIKTDNSYKNNSMYSLCTHNDYHIQGYTIEIVGRALNNYITTGNTGTSLLAFDRQCSPKIAINSNGYFEVLSRSTGSNQDIMPKQFDNLMGKTCTFTINLAELSARNAGGYITIDYAVNGDGWYTTTRDNPAYQTSRGNNCTIMCYYAYQSNAVDNVLNNSEIYSIRIYNRKLTTAELSYNSDIDKARFNID